MTTRHLRRRLTLSALSLTLLVAHGCSERSPSGAVDTQPTESKPSTTGTKPAPAPPATQPVEPAPEPVATRPGSTFDPNPPYPVDLYVTDPEEKQPGWLTVLAMTDGAASAKVKGSFPEHNRIYVDTLNVRRLRLHISYLPLAERKSIVLRIDEQTIQLARKQRKYVYLDRSDAGLWEVGKPPGD